MDARFDAHRSASYVLGMRTQILPALVAIVAAACLLTEGVAAQELPSAQPDPSLPFPSLSPSPPSGDQGARPRTPPDITGPGVVSPAPKRNNAARSKAPKDREAMLAELYGRLAKAPDAEQAAPIAKAIEVLWLNSGSPTIGLLMHRALKAVNDERNDLALKLLNAVVDLSPDYAEGFSRRAYVYYLQNDYDRAVGDLRRALALEPNHFKALDGLARILRESGQKKSALKVYRQLLRIYPFMPGAKEAVDELSVEVEGQGI